MHMPPLGHYPGKCSHRAHYSQPYFEGALKMNDGQRQPRDWNLMDRKMMDKVLGVWKATY